MPTTALKVADLRKLARLTNDALRLHVGPLVLVERPEEQALQREELRVAMAGTVPAKPRVARHALALMLRFGEMQVIPLGAEAPEGSLTLGRGADCDVQTTHPSTSARHARIRWDGWKRAAWVCDLGSTNGTWVNGEPVSKDETALAEGDVISLGDSGYLFLSTETLQAMLKAD